MTFLKYFIALVWLVNGLFCKLLGLVPRHQEIVGRILSAEFSGVLTKMIGAAEIGMTVWILSGVAPRLNAVTQILLVAAMNIIEFFLAPDLLWWGKGNAIFALAFIVLIYANEFYLKPSQK